MTSKPRLRVAPAAADDVATILRLVTGLAEYEKLADTVTASESGLREALFGARPFAEAVVGFADDEPVGLAVFYPTFSTFSARAGLYLEDLFVAPRWRGHGLGKKLLAHVARLAIERGCKSLDWSVLDWNEPAIEFYRALGARPLDQWNLFRLTGDAMAELASARDAGQTE